MVENSKISLKDTLTSYGFDGQSQLYSSLRPLYPPRFFSTILSKLAQKRVCLDIGCGTGQISQFLAPHFEQLIGIDIQQKQLDEANEQLKIFPNVKLRVHNANEIERFVVEEQIEGKVDLIIFGQSFHWFEVEKLLPKLQRVLEKSGGLFVLCGYWYPEVIAIDMQTSFKPYLDNIEAFDKFHDQFTVICKEQQEQLIQIRDAFDLYKDQINPYYAFDPNALRSFYQTYQFESSFKSVAKIFEATLKFHSLEELIAYQLTISAQRLYQSKLEEEGTYKVEEDYLYLLAEKFKNIIQKTNPDKDEEEIKVILKAHGIPCAYTFFCLIMSPNES